MYIYLTINNTNGKSYVGQSTRNIIESINYIGSGTLIRAAIKKYGRNNFTKIILQKCNSIKELNDAEIFWIKTFNAVKSEFFYNLHIGGINTDKTSIKISKSRKNKTWEEIYSKEGLEIMKKVADKSWKVLNEYWMNRSAKERSENAKKANKARTKNGYKHTLETKKKIKEKNILTAKNNPITEEKRKKISKATKNAMKKIDMVAVTKKALKGRKKYWNKKHEKDKKIIKKMLEENKLKKEICIFLNISYTTLASRIKEIQ